MGIIPSSFRKKKTTIEILEDLDSQIEEIQQFGQKTEQRHEKVVRKIIFYGVLLYVMIASIFYFCFFPASLYNQLIYITSLLLFPILIFLTKKMVSWYYNRKITHIREKLSIIVSEKKKILNEVIETETYKKAKEILWRFAPEELNMSPLTQRLSGLNETPRRPMPQAVISPLPGSAELRRRAISTQNQPQHSQIVAPGSAPSNIKSVNPMLNTPFQSSARKINFASIGFHYEAVVKLPDGFNGTDLRNVCTETGLFAKRLERENVIQEDFMIAVRKVSDNKKLVSKLDYKPV